MAMNMEYCRFRNTLLALKELDFSNTHNKTLSRDEMKARQELIELMLEVVEPFLDEVL